MKLSICLFTLILCLFLLPLNSEAGGLGIFVPATFGNADFSGYSHEENHFGIGFLFDTNVAENHIFHYRLNAGLEFFEHTYPEFVYDNTLMYYVESRTDAYALMRIALDNTFGFAVLRTQVLRLWLGPQVRLGWILGDRSGVTLGAGLTLLGMNFNMGSVFTLSLEAGYRFAGNIYFDTVSDYSYDGTSWDSEGSINNEAYMKLSFIFRLGDIYERY